MLPRNLLTVFWSLLLSGGRRRFQPPRVPFVLESNQFFEKHFTNCLVAEGNLFVFVLVMMFVHSET